MKVEGVFVALVTPFERDGHIDAAQYTKHLEYLQKAKVHGVVPCGTTGEAPVLERDERKFLIEEAAQFAKSTNLKVIAGCGSNSTYQALRNCEEAAKYGAMAALMVTPYYNKPNQEGLLAHYLFLADRSPIPIILYNVPSRTNVPIHLDTVIRLMEHPNIIGIKESSGSYSQWLGISASVDLNRKSLLAGDDDIFTAILSLKGSGIISTTTNLVPRAFIDIYQAHQNNRPDEALRIQKNLYPLVRAMFLETNPAPLKYALESLNRMPGYLRLPMVRVSRQTEESIQLALQSAKAFL